MSKESLASSCLLMILVLGGGGVGAACYWRPVH